MDWKLFFSTFGAIFVAELGDKTQLAAMSLSAGNKNGKWIVFAASALALTLSSALAVAIGEGLTKVIPPIWLKRGAGAIFIVLGVLFLVRKSD